MPYQTPGGILLEAWEHYPKQTFRNRALILTAQGAKPLTVPVRPLLIYFFLLRCFFSHSA